jgi:hypothetical protein
MFFKNKFQSTINEAFVTNMVLLTLQSHQLFTHHHAMIGYNSCANLLKEHGHLWWFVFLERGYTLKHNVKTLSFKHLYTFVYTSMDSFFVTFHSLYFPNQNISIPIYGPWSFNAILHIHNMSHFTKSPIHYKWFTLTIKPNDIFKCKKKTTKLWPQ